MLLSLGRKRKRAEPHTSPRRYVPSRHVLRRDWLMAVLLCATGHTRTPDQRPSRSGQDQLQVDEPVRPVAGNQYCSQRLARVTVRSTYPRGLLLRYESKRPHQTARSWHTSSLPTRTVYGTSPMCVAKGLRYAREQVFKHPTFDHYTCVRKKAPKLISGLCTIHYALTLNPLTMNNSSPCGQLKHVYSALH